MEAVIHGDHKFSIWSWNDEINFDGAKITVRDLYNNNFDADGNHKRFTAEDFSSRTISETENFINVAAEAWFGIIKGSRARVHKGILVTVIARKFQTHMGNNRGAVAFATKVGDTVIYADTFASMKTQINAALKGGK